jgi:hypothetical protein
MNSGVRTLTPQLNRPDDIRQACREAGYEWAEDQAVVLGRQGAGLWPVLGRAIGGSQ